MKKIYCWDGNYFGFINNGHLFRKDSTYIGWVEDDGTVWHENGKFMGEIHEEDYILRKENMMEPMQKMKKMRPMTPMIPMAPMNKLAKMGKMGWRDPLPDLLPEDD